MKNFKVQILGGAFQKNAEQNKIGSSNYETTRTILQNAEILIVSEDIGGMRVEKFFLIPNLAI